MCTLVTQHANPRTYPITHQCVFDPKPTPMSPIQPTDIRCVDQTLKPTAYHAGYAANPVNSNVHIDSGVNVSNSAYISEATIVESDVHSCMARWSR